EGNSDIDKEDLEKQINIKTYTVVDIAAIKKARAALLKYYEEKGFFLASIKDELRPAPKDPEAETDDSYLELVFKISENSKIKVDKITILGNKHISDEELKNIIETKEKGPFSFISGSGNYRESIVDIDRERIGFYYTTKGYPHVQITGPITHVTPDKKWIYLTYSVTEGEKYDFGEVMLKTEDVLYTEEELREELKLKPGDVYNSMQVREQIIKYEDMYGDKGYAFTNVVPVPTYNEDKKTVDFLFDIDKGRKVYFGKFKISGNTKTRDKVVRRELRINEGELFNHSRKELSREKIMALGFFDDVVFNQYTPKAKDGSTPDVVNIDVQVKEKASTGQFMLSAGYSTYEGFIIMAQIQENNFLGRGQTVTLRASLGKLSKLYYLSFYDPYFLDSSWGWGMDLYRESREATAFTTVRTGADMRFGYPIADFSRIYMMYKLEHSKTNWISTLSNIFDPNVENGYTSSVTFTLEHDRRNDRLNPIKGLYNAISSEVAGLGGNKDFVKTVIDNRFYQPLFWNIVFKTRLLIGNISGFAGKPLPYSERFLMGGIDTLRGYEYLSLGPQVYDTTGRAYAVGGKNELLYTAECEFPIVSDVGIRGVAFFDAGNSYNNFGPGLRTDVPLRSNWGLGFRWNSPMGQLRFEWGVPISRKPNEDRTVFQFMIGPSF
ncbi:MAG: outer membrane protein assembly factor BamA, partial [Pseudomonadota bacterium]